MKNKKFLLGIAEYLRHTLQLPAFADVIEETIRDYEALLERLGETE